MVGNLKKITVFFKFPTVFLRKKEEEKGKRPAGHPGIAAPLGAWRKCCWLPPYGARQNAH